MRFLATAIAVAVLTPAGAWACGQGFRTPPYQNLLGATTTLAVVDLAFLLYDVLPAPRSPGVATAELAVAAAGTASSLAVAFTNDARANGARPVLLGFGLVSALLATHAVSVLASGQRPTLEVSAGSGVGHGTLGTRIALRHDGFGAHLAAGMPLAYGYQGIGGGLSWVGDGRVAPLVAVNAAMQTLPDSSLTYGDTRALLSFSAQVGLRLRAGKMFLELAAGPVAQRVSATPWKQWRGDTSSGWTAAAAGSDFRSAGAWPLPLDATLAAGVAL